MFLTSNPHALDVSEDGYDVQWATNALGMFSSVSWKDLYALILL